MHLDPRGGHNKKQFNENFFKKWSPTMAYVLGFISADGSVIDARKSSRTCYTSIKITDLKLLEKIRETMSSCHNIYETSERYNKFSNKIYLCKKIYTLKFGSKRMFQDLVNLGIVPRKSLRLKLPLIPGKYLSFFVRGYFDGDGCLYVAKIKKGYSAKIQVIFTSGCGKFLTDLSQKLSAILQINTRKVAISNRAYQLRYQKRESLKILNFIYKDLHKSPYLNRKYRIAKLHLSP